MGERQSSDRGAADSSTEARDIPIIVLPGAITLGDVSGLHDAFVAAVARGRGLCVDAAMVERMTTPAVQLLLVVIRHLRAQGDPAIVRNASPQTVAAFEELGLGDEFHIWRTAT